MTETPEQQDEQGARQAAVRAEAGAEDHEATSPEVAEADEMAQAEEVEETRAADPRQTGQRLDPSD